MIENHLKNIFCNVELPVLWVLAKATCFLGKHFGMALWSVTPLLCPSPSPVSCRYFDFKYVNFSLSNFSWSNDWSKSRKCQIQKAFNTEKTINLTYITFQYYTNLQIKDFSSFCKYEIAIPILFQSVRMECIFLSSSE